MSDELLDIFEELNKMYEDNELKEELNIINKKEIEDKNIVKVFANKKFEKSWKELNIPNTACTMKTDDFNEMMQKVVEMKW